MKVWTISLGYVPARIWEKSLQEYIALKNPAVDYTHIFIDQHYPMGGEENRRQLWDICRRHGVWVLDPGRNLGLHGGFNFALDHINLKDDDIVIGYDPDSKPISPGFDGALVDALRFDDKLAWTSLMSYRVIPELKERGYTERKVRHIDVWVTHRAVVNSVCAWKASFLRSVGGLIEHKHWYGHLEAPMFDRIKSKGLEWGFLPGWHETDELRSMQDPEFFRWKWYYSHCHAIDYDFTEYVKRGCPKLPGILVPGELP